MSHDIFEIVRIIVVIALVIFAAALATPKGRLPLALRGLARIMRKDLEAAGRADAVPVWKRLLAFVLVLMAAAIALIIV